MDVNKRRKKKDMLRSRLHKEQQPDNLTPLWNSQVSRSASANARDVFTRLEALASGNEVRIMRTKGAIDATQRHEAQLQRRLRRLKNQLTG